MISSSDLEEAYGPRPEIKGFGEHSPECMAPTCFIGSYAPITPAGKLGPFWTNTYFLQNDRNKEIAGPVKVKSGTYKI